MALPYSWTMLFALIRWLFVESVRKIFWFTGIFSIYVLATAFSHARLPRHEMDDKG